MIEMGEIHPQSALGPQRAPDGSTTLGRLTTTDEQRLDAIRQITEHVKKVRGSQIRAKVMWTRGEPTILTVTFSVEHIDGKPVYLPAKIEEFTEAGATIMPSEEARFATLTEELRDLHDRGML